MTTATSLPAAPALSGVAAVPVWEPAPLRRGVVGLRRLAALFILLWIFEGALRKWVFPGLANPLLVVRDPVLLLIYFQALRHGFFPRHPLVFALLGLGTLCLGITLLTTATPPLVAFFGFRASFLHLPLIFLLPQILDRATVLHIGRGLLWLAAPMAVLVLLQFIAPSTGWLNTGAGGGEGGQIESGMGHVRPAGTFSFTNGLVTYTALVLAFFLYQVLVPRTFPKTLWLVSGGALVVIVALSGSRQMVGLTVISILAVAATCLVRPVFLKSSFKLLVIAGVVGLALSSFAVFREGLGVMSYRFGDEENVRKGFVGRYFEGLLVNSKVWQSAQVLGVGLGRGTNAGAGLMTGQRVFLLAESDWDRVVLETGPLLGSTYILLRTALVALLIRGMWRGLRHGGDPLGLMLGAACLTEVFQGQFAQPTALGYATIAGGLCLSAANVADRRPRPLAARRGGLPAAPVPGSPGPASPALLGPPPPATLPRGRSRYAEQLHGGGPTAEVLKDA